MMRDISTPIMAVLEEQSPVTAQHIAKAIGRDVHSVNCALRYLRRKEWAASYGTTPNGPLLYVIGPKYGEIDKLPPWPSLDRMPDLAIALGYRSRVDGKL